jgi:hypothetical protein
MDDQKNVHGCKSVDYYKLWVCFITDYAHSAASLAKRNLWLMKACSLPSGWSRTTKHPSPCQFKQGLGILFWVDYNRAKSRKKSLNYDPFGLNLAGINMQKQLVDVSFGYVCVLGDLLIIS